MVSMSTEANKAIVRRLFDDVWNAGRTDSIAELYAEDYVADYRPYAPLRRGRDGIRDMVQRAWATYPDYHEELIEMIAEGDKVVARFLITGTQSGALGPIPPSGKKVSFEEIVVLTLRDGKVVHQRGIVDNLNLLRQLGLVPTPPE
jgi:steroid delta-isomerase-like uncharacterized protein